MEKEFIELVAESLNVGDLESLTAESTLDSLGADSLDRVELLMAVEDKYNITIPDDSSDKFKNLGDLWNYVHENGSGYKG
jgi:acyl carrier protein